MDGCRSQLCILAAVAYIACILLLELPELWPQRREIPRAPYMAPITPPPPSLDPKPFTGPAAAPIESPDTASQPSPTPVTNLSSTASLVPWSWPAYQAAIYGSTGMLSPHAPQLLYSRSFFRASSAGLAPRLASDECFMFTGLGDRPCSEPSKDRFGGSGSLVYNPRYKRTAMSPSNWNHSDHSWVEVTRFGPEPCSAAQSHHMCEGRVHPWTERRSQQQQLHGSSLASLAASTRPFGCWFFIASGSGVWVNIGRSLRFPSRAAAWRMLGNKLRVPASQRLADSACRDYLWCSAALQLGADSIQVRVDGHATCANLRYVSHRSKLDREMSELVICSGRCSDVPVCGVCPPVPLRTGVLSDSTGIPSDPCTCSENVPILNCGQASARATCQQKMLGKHRGHADTRQTTLRQ